MTISFFFFFLFLRRPSLDTERFLCKGRASVMEAVAHPTLFSYTHESAVVGQVYIYSGTTGVELLRLCSQGSCEPLDNEMVVIRRNNEGLPLRCGGLPVQTIEHVLYRVGNYRPGCSQGSYDAPKLRDD